MFCCRRIPIEDVPVESDEVCGEWLHELYRNKVGLIYSYSACVTVFIFVIYMNSMKLVIPLHSLYWSIHTKDESKRGTAFTFIFGVN